MNLKAGTAILYKMKDKVQWKRGVIIGYPADELIEIGRKEDMPNEAFTGSKFAVSIDIMDIKEERPEEAQLSPTVVDHAQAAKDAAS